jgi:hypothetical protein
LRLTPFPPWPKPSIMGSGCKENKKK